MLEFPENRENNREFADFWPFRRFMALIYEMIPMCCRKFPMWRNRESVSREQGMHPQEQGINRDFASTELREHGPSVGGKIGAARKPLRKALISLV